MLGIYFSGTGNTRYCVEKFVKEDNIDNKAISIEDPNVLKEMQESDIIAIGYPVYYSNIPTILREFIVKNQLVFKGKSVFVIATMAMFSGDGAGYLARILSGYGANIIGGLHITMPDCICDEKVLKRSIEANSRLVKKGEAKINKAVEQFKKCQPTKEGLGLLSHILGLMIQRIWFYHKIKEYSNKIKIDQEKCIGCGICVNLCPMKNLSMDQKVAVQNNQCTLCYRCVSNCPRQAITLLGNKIYEQCKIEKYI